MKGFTLMEVIVAILILGVVMLGITQSTQTSYRASYRTIRNSQNLALAQARLEELSSLDRSTLTNALNGTATIEQSGTTYEVTTTITENADGSALAVVNVTNSAEQDVELSMTFAPWGLR